MVITNVCIVYVTLAMSNHYLHKHDSCSRFMNRAKTVIHAEYEIIKHIISTVDISDVKERLCPDGDEHALTRFNKGAENVANLIQNLADRRTHRLPNEHVAYESKLMKKVKA